MGLACEIRVKSLLKDALEWNSFRASHSRAVFVFSVHVCNALTQPCDLQSYCFPQREEIVSILLGILTRSQSCTRTPRLVVSCIAACVNIYSGDTWGPESIVKRTVRIIRITVSASRDSHSTPSMVPCLPFFIRIGTHHASRAPALNISSMA